MPTRYLFIDGGCLRATLTRISDRYFEGKPIRIDYNRLRGEHQKVFYYDAIPAAKPGEPEEIYVERIKERVGLHNQLANLPHYHVYEGDSRIRRKQVQQKQVDVMIAVDMLTHTFRRNMDSATFLASDLDFKPLLDALVREGMFVNLLYPPSDTSPDLLNSADQRTPLSIDYVYPFLDRNSQSLISLPARGQENKVLFQLTGSRHLMTHETLGSISYIQRGDQHIAFWDYPENIDTYLCVYHSTPTILRAYLEDHYLIFLPDGALSID